MGAHNDLLQVRKKGGEGRGLGQGEGEDEPKVLAGLCA